MECSFTDPEKIKEWIEICKLMKTLDKYVCFKFTPMELTVQMIHPSKRSLLDMRFPKDWFHHYDWKESELYVSTKSLYTIFSIYSGENMISMESANKFMNVKFFHEHHTKNFSIPLNIRTSRDVFLEKDAGVQLCIESTYLNSLCEELYKFGDTLRFRIGKDLFHMISHGNEKMVIEINPTKIDILHGGDYDQSFPLLYVLLFLNFSVLYPKVVLHLHKLLQVSIEKGYTLHYYVLPCKS